MQDNGELRFLQQKLTGRNVVFDVGANVGDWSANALKIESQILLHCFEPSKSSFEQLKGKLISKNIRLNNFGLSSQSEERDLYIFEDKAGLNSLYKRHGLDAGWNIKSPERTERIRLETLDWYCQTNRIEWIDFMKVDVEGHELEVFKGGTNLFRNHQVQTVQFEYGGCNIDSGVLLRDYFSFFLPLGYSLWKIYPDGLRQYPQYDQRLENFQYQNWAVLWENE